MRGSRSRQQQQHQGEHQSILNSLAEFAACLFSRMAAEPTLTEMAIKYFGLCL